MLVSYHFMWIYYHFRFRIILWCNLTMAGFRSWFDLLCGYLGELVSRLDPSLLVINQIRIQLDIGDWLNKRFFIKRMGSWTWNYLWTWLSGVDFGLMDMCKLDLPELVDLQIWSRFVTLFGSVIEIDESGSGLMTLYRIG